MWKSARWAVAALLAPALCGGAGECRATDLFRRIGVGYSAGYNAPAPGTCAPTAHKMPGWAGWRGADCQPGGTTLGRGCCLRHAPALLGCPSCLQPACVAPAPCANPCGCGPLPTCPCAVMN